MTFIGGGPVARYKNVLRFHFQIEQLAIWFWNVHAILAFPLRLGEADKMDPSWITFMDEEESATKVLNVLDSFRVVTRKGKSKLKTMPVSKTSRSTLVDVQF